MRLRASAPSTAIGAVLLIIALSVMSLNLVNPSPQTGNPQSTTRTRPSRPYPTPTSFIWETANAPQYLDPTLEYNSQDAAILQNVYEPLLWYSGGSTSAPTPWLAQTITQSVDLKTYAITLRSGIAFADGESFNSSAVYFSLNRVLINDGNQPNCRGCGSGWVLDQFENHALSQFYCGPCADYSAKWVAAVLGENLVQSSGPLTLTISVQNPQASFPSVLATDFVGAMMAPSYVMQHDLSFWTSQGFNLPYPTFTGTLQQRMVEYFNDEAALCNTALNSNGCGQTYLATSSAGSLAGTGPYTLTSFDPSTSDVVLSANANYWGGPYGNISASIPTIYVNYVPNALQRLKDLAAAGSTIGSSKEGFMSDIPNNQLYSVANSVDWQATKTLSSVVPGVSLYGPYTQLGVYFSTFDTNVTNPATGEYNSFQPFADRRIRLAFADAVNVSYVNDNFNNGMGQVANMADSPGLLPGGAYSSTITPAYSYNLGESANLLVSAMESPLTSFTLESGAPAAPGTFDNTFGCTTLNPNNQCDNPVRQTVILGVPPGGFSDLDQLYMEMAANINQISQEYNMGLNVVVQPVSLGQLIQEAIGQPHTSVYGYQLGWLVDYPWTTDFDTPILAPGGTYTGPNGWNTTAMASLFQQELAAGSTGDLAGEVAASNSMNSLANQQVMYLWMTYPSVMFALTSNVAGVYYSPYLFGIYFAALS